MSIDWNMVGAIAGIGAVGLSVITLLVPYLKGRRESRARKAAVTGELFDAHLDGIQRGGYYLGDPSIHSGLQATIRLVNTCSVALSVREIRVDASKLDPPGVIAGCTFTPVLPIVLQPNIGQTLTMELIFEFREVRPEESPAWIGLAPLIVCAVDDLGNEHPIRIRAGEGFRPL